MRLVYYSIAAPEDAPRPDLFWQLEASVRSLRAYNEKIPLHVFAYGDLPSAVAAALRSYGAEVHRKGCYYDRLNKSFPRGAEVLNHYPLLHKWLNLDDLTALAPTQVLYLDCDTLFFDDVEKLFERYATYNCYAREEPTCRRSHLGYDPAYVNEEALAAVALGEGVQAAPPFNLGVVLMNHGLWQRLARQAPTLLFYAWRFAIWMALNPARGMESLYGEGQGISFVREHFGRFLAPGDVRYALPFPSANRWILDQVALWMTLGHVPEFSYGDFSAGDVLQNGEIMNRKLELCDWILCHYYSQNMERMDKWIRDNNATMQFL